MKKGYGVFEFRPRFHDNRNMTNSKTGNKVYTWLAHRLALTLVTGPSHLLCLHLCDNRKCCYPNHLRWGTDGENMLEMVAKGRGQWRGYTRAQAATKLARIQNNRHHKP